jgi:predicted ArsR family transcriptional regulator
MSLRLALVERSLPAPLRHTGLSELVSAAAEAFGRTPPTWRGKTHEERLLAFARFTADQAAAAEETGRAGIARDELRRASERLGRRLRRRLGVRSHEEALRALKVLYRHLGIELHAQDDGALEVTSCLFSRIYGPATCRIMSAMDEGVVSGLTGGCRLRFERRLTEGAASCVASLTRREACGRSS